MKLSEIYSSASPVISLEIFPPKADNFDKKCENLKDRLIELSKFNPALVSVTYGAGGANREKSLEILKLVKSLDITVMPHFTCVCSDSNYILSYLNQIQELEIKNILALRGDEPDDARVCYIDFKSAIDLIEFIKKNSDLEFCVAGYPEKHPKAACINSDIEVLKKKEDLGAKVCYTQLFFDNDKFYRFFDLCQKKNIQMPIIAGVLPVSNYSQMKRIVELSNCAIDKKTQDFFDKYKDSKEDMIKAGIEFASIQVQKLLEFGTKGIHFYTLNQAHSTCEVIKNTISQAPQGNQPLLK